ncbi:cyanophycinase [Segetibacter aerophilus]|uniref:Cyanophycinase n=1 Tax=Segetibacter aerophilus TaxID=670293 RepID=A0A512BJ45_9BACT|nr:cyanophycinase [Segetibacter aerophilus]GEO11988.1 cyanophycinase [Segetibacter aerophilus]
MAEDNKSACPVPAGTLLIIGGAENKGEQKAKKKQTPSDFERLQVLKSFIHLTGKEDPQVEVITSASTEGDESFEDYRKAFEECNIFKVGHIHHTHRQDVLDDEALVERMEKTDGIFFAGGDQLKYTYLYGGTRFLTALKHRYINDKIVIAGTSAGAMSMSTPMIYAGNDEVQELGGMIKITTGLEFLKDVCIDTHFVQRGRFVRMAQVVATNPTCIGMGIEEDTAMIVRNGLDAEVVGTGTIIIIEGFHVSEVSIDEFTSDKPVTIRNLRTHILSDGDKFTIAQNNPPHV